MRVFTFLVILLFFNSCDYFSFKKNSNPEKLDSIVDVTSVDTFPSFQVCDSIINKTEKTACFRKTIHQEITQSLANQKIRIRSSIDETINVIITIHPDSRITLKSVKASENVYQEIANLKEVIEKSIGDLPKVFPAIKRGIPVTSEYILPIRIRLEN